MFALPRCLRVAPERILVRITTQEGRYGGGVSEPREAPSGAVFLSYASEDAEAAQRIWDSLRAAAIAADPNYALANTARSLALSDYIYQWGLLHERREAFEEERTDAERAITLAPELGEAHK